MNVLPITAVVAALQAEVADLMARDLAMLGEIVGKPSAAGASAGTSTAAKPGAVPTAAASPTSPTPTPPPDPVAQAVTVARADAAGRQAGLAPLMADLAQVEEGPALPAPVRAAIAQVLDLQTPLDGPLTAQVVARAVAQSGLFLEAHLAAAPGRPPAPDLKAALLTLQQALTPPPPEAPAAPTPALKTIPGQPAAPSQAAPPNPPAAQPSAPSVRPQPAASPPTQAPSTPVPSAAATPPAPDLRTAVQTLQQAVTAPAGEAPALPTAIKAALVQLLAPPVTPEGAPPAQTIAPTIAKAVAQLAPLLEAYLAAPEEEPVPPEIKAALQTLQQALADPPDDKPALPPRAAPPSPPSREGATTAQAAQRPSLPEHADAQTITQVLARGVDQALARQTLHQLASLPDGPSQVWMFELPIATPQGAAIAQFRVDRDGQGGAGGGEGGEAGWRVRFSIDIEPLGPVHVQLAAGGERAAVTVWAERPEGLLRLRSLGGELERALPADVRFQPGAPRPPAPPSPGRFVDQSS